MRSCRFGIVSAASPILALSICVLLAKRISPQYQSEENHYALALYTTGVFLHAALFLISASVFGCASAIVAMVRKEQSPFWIIGLALNVLILLVCIAVFARNVAW